ncbi:MAG: hypothetical protein LUQ26_05320 [Methylococcaceae bacterium]|nr:hypothetical protein [Methylococcaceae bacterium]
MTEYNVKWEIELDASSPEEAAKFALAIHRDPESTATVFEVKDTALTNPLIFIIDTRALPEKKLDLSTVPIDAKVIVWDNAGSQIKHRRHFAGVDIHGKAMTWYQGQSSWTQSGFAKTSWDHCILEELDELKLVELLYADIPIDTKVVVWNALAGKKRNRYFAGVNEEGKPATWMNGQTSWSSSDKLRCYWDHCVLAEPEESKHWIGDESGEDDFKPYAPELSMLDCATVGDNFDADPNGSATAGIHLPNHGNAIEVYAETTPKAIALRDAILKRIRREYD